MGITTNIDAVDMAFKVIGLVVLLVIILFVLTWTGLVKCSQVPYWCDVYEMVLGQPRVLIVYGDSGLGNPEALKLMLQDPRTVGANAVDLTHIDRLSLGNLKQYKLVIVEKSRVMSTEQLEMFRDYVWYNGGRLVWIADAGVEKAESDIKNVTDANGAAANLDAAWVRVKDNDTEYDVIAFDEFLGISFIGNYCTERDCVNDNFTVGKILSENTGNHPLIYGSSPALNLKINKDRDFSIVKQFPNASTSNRVLTLDIGGKTQGKAHEIERYLPMIVTSQSGERVAYYAYPPEYFALDNNYNTYIKNMYYGMLGK